MLRKFQSFAAQFQHRGLRGTAREDIVSEFLNAYLPAHIEFVKGEIYDSFGMHSPQCDIIAIDRLKVPLMFGTDSRLVPIEGVYSVLEVKSNLDSKELNDCLGKCDKIKNLQKVAYIPQTGPIFGSVSAYGKILAHYPTLYSVFAYHGIDPKTLVAKLESYHAGKPPEKRIDSVNCLDGWVLCWWEPDSDQYDLIASPTSRLAIVEAKAPSLLFFYLMYYRWLCQATCQPIDMVQYAQGFSLGDRTYPAS